MLYFLMIQVALASSLKEGMRGKRWGQAITHTGECETRDKETICPEEVTGIPVNVSYGTWPSVGLYSIYLQAEGFANCATLRDILGEAWGRGFPNSQYLTGKMDNWSWKEGAYIGSFKFNHVNSHCYILAMDSKRYDVMEAEKKEEAKKAASSL
jgi:hypothetical protein